MLEFVQNLTNFKYINLNDFVKNKERKRAKSYNKKWIQTKNLNYINIVKIIIKICIINYYQINDVFCVSSFPFCGFFSLTYSLLHSHLLLLPLLLFFLVFSVLEALLFCKPYRAWEGCHGKWFRCMDCFFFLAASISLKKLFIPASFLFPSSSSSSSTFLSCTGFAGSVSASQFQMHELSSGSPVVGFLQSSPSE